MKEFIELRDALILWTDLRNALSCFLNSAAIHFQIKLRRHIRITNLKRDSMLEDSLGNID